MKKITQHQVINALYHHFLLEVFDNFGKRKGAATQINFCEHIEIGKEKEEWIEIILENKQIIKYKVEINKGNKK